MKTATPRSRVSRLILEEASEWFVDFRVGDVDAHARARFDEWLRRSPEHIRAYMEIARTYVELPALQVAGKLDVDALVAYARSGENVVPFDNTASEPANKSRTRCVPRNPDEMRLHLTARRRRRYRFLAASSCALVLVLVIVSALRWRSEHYPTYSTDIGERRSIELADGSTVDLNARSQIRVEFSGAERRVELLDGQALFEVAKEKNRPFIVRSGDATVRAVGTQFDVYRKEKGTTVTVLEGRVAVYSNERGNRTAASPASLPAAGSTRAIPQNWLTVQSSAPLGSSGVSPAAPRIAANPSGLADPSDSAGVFLSADEQVTVTPGQAPSMPAHADIAAATAWTERRLIFDGARLSDVVQEFNRYNRRQLIIEDGQLSDIRVSGVFSSTDPTSLIRFLRAQPGMKLAETDKDIRIAGQ
jgi:transmembrane sensor